MKIDIFAIHFTSITVTQKRELISPYRKLIFSGNLLKGGIMVEISMNIITLVI